MHAPNTLSVANMSSEKPAHADAAGVTLPTSQHRTSTATRDDEETTRPTADAAWSSDTDEDPDSDKPPDGGYGWVCVLALLATNASTWGINTTYGVFSSYYIENNYYKASQLEYAWVGGMSVAVAYICGPPANYLTDRFNFRVPMLLGATCIVLGQCMAAICSSFGPFLVCQGIVFGIGLGMALIPSYPILAQWFDKRLALAQGLSNAGSGIGALILSNTTGLLLQSLGVKWTLIINGCISGALLVPAIFLLRTRHTAVKARNVAFQPSFILHPGYRWVLLWAALAMMSYFIGIYTIASFASDGLGLSQTQAAAVQSILAVGQIVGRPALGFLLDWGGRINIVILSYIVCGIATLAMWLPARSYAVIAVYALVQGATGGAIVSTSTPVAASVVGVPDLGSALAIYWLIMAVPSLVAQPMVIALLDYSRTNLGRTGAEAYSISIGLTGGIALFSSVLLFGAKVYLQGGSWAIFRKV